MGLRPSLDVEIRLDMDLDSRTFRAHDICL
jgi:hypothetical protein